MMIFAIGAVPGTYAVSTELVAFEVIRGLVGSLGIIAAVPLTTAIAVLAVGDRSRPPHNATTPPNPRLSGNQVSTSSW